MSSKPIVVVVGATGHQGGSVADWLVKDGKYHVRGLTRKPDSVEAKKLTAKGVEVIGCDVSERKDLEKAFKGAWAVFGLTQFWEHGAEKELAQGLLQVDVAWEQGVELFIYCSLANVEKVSGGKLDVPHFTGKAEIEEYARKKGFKYTSFPQAACYFENFEFLGAFMLKENKETGTYEWNLPCKPTTQIDWISIGDYGAAVLAVIKDPVGFNGRAWPVTSQRASFSELSATIEKVTGKKVNYRNMPYEEAVTTGNRELAETFKWFEEYGYYGPNVSDITEFKRIYPQAKRFEQWLQTSKFAPRAASR